MKNTLLKLSTIAIFTGMAMASQASVILTVAGEVQASDSLSGQQQSFVSGGTGAPFEAQQQVANFNINAQVPELIFPEGPDFPIAQSEFVERDRELVFEGEFEEDLPNNDFPLEEVPFFSAASAFAFANDAGQFGLSANAQGISSAFSEITQSYVLTNGDFAGDYVFNFQIERGLLIADCAGLFAFESVGPDSCGSIQSSNNASAYFSAAIFIERASGSIEQLFRSEVRITSDGDTLRGISDRVVDTGTDSIGTEVSSRFSPTSVTYEIAPELKTIPIGRLLANEEVKVSYVVKTSSATWFDTNAELLTATPYAGVNFGDPSGFNGQFPAFSNIQSVSAPGNLLILGFGVVALAFARKRKAN